ncbi:MAG: hypothetical protein IJ773_10605 [Lachnospiraceae bacterium]|nr:hypothetical protein [Lachnospiraceae bacterium]
MKKVSIFLGISFEDMYSERDFLYAEVFPELKKWCRDRKLALEILDPGYDMTEEKCRMNAMSLLISLKGIDRCRPFFLGFLGQHRGYIPKVEEIAPDTYRQYPGLEQYIGSHSFLELCLIHAILDPMAEKLFPATHCILYEREPDYLPALLKAHPKLRYAYTNEPTKKSLFSRENRIQTEEMNHFRSIASERALLVRYHADWDPEKSTPELYEYEGADYSAGGLTGFRIPAQFLTGKGAGSMMDQILPPQSLKEHILSQLEDAITEELPYLPDTEFKKNGAEADATDSLYVDTMKLISEENRTKLKNLPGFDDPVYRMVILKELREYPDTEAFMNSLESVYGTTPKEAFDGMLRRLLRPAGREWLKELLGFLVFHPGGVIWEKLPGWMQSYEGKTVPIKLPAESKKVLYYLADFLSTDEKGIYCYYESMKKAGEAILKEDEPSFHRALTQEYLKECKPVGDTLNACDFSGEDPDSYAGLSWHAAHAQVELLEALLNNPYFIMKKAALCGMTGVLGDFSLLSLSPRKDEFKQLSRILQLSRDILNEDPEQLYGQLLLKKNEKPDARIDEMLDILREDHRKPRLLPIQKYGEDADSPLQNRFRVLLKKSGEEAVFWNHSLIVRQQDTYTLYDKFTGRIRKKGAFPLPKGHMQLCGGALIAAGTLADPVYGLSSDGFTFTELLPAREDETESGQAYFYVENENLRMAAIRKGTVLCFFNASTGELIREKDLEDPSELLEMDEAVYLLKEHVRSSLAAGAAASDEAKQPASADGNAETEELIRLSLYERATDRLLGRTHFPAGEPFTASLTEEFVLCHTDQEAVVFRKKNGEVVLHLPEAGREKRIPNGLYADEEYLFVALDNGYVDLYHTSPVALAGCLKLGDAAIRQLSSNAACVYTLDANGVVNVWDRNRLSRRETEVSPEDKKTLDVFQANGSVYTFSKTASRVLSPVNLKVVRRGVGITHYNPELELKRYLISWSTDPLTLSLYNTETLQNDYTCRVKPPEGYTAEDLVKVYWKDTTSYFLFVRENGNVAVLLLDMNTDSILRVVELPDMRVNPQIFFAENRVFLFSEYAEKGRYSYPGECWCEIRDLEEDGTRFYIPLEKGTQVSGAFVDEKELVMIYRGTSNGEVKQDLLTVNLTSYLQKKRSGELVTSALHHMEQIPDGEVKLVHMQNHIALYQYEDGGYFLYRSETGEIWHEESRKGARIISASLGKGNCFLARENGVIEYVSYEDESAFCRASLDQPVKKILGTGAGLVTAWTADDTLISFQVERARN